MLQKIWAAARTKQFIFNAATVLILTLTAVTIPKLVGEIKTSAAQDKPAVTVPKDIKEAEIENSGENNIIEPTILDEVTGGSDAHAAPEANTVQELELRATLLETAWGDKFWKLSVWDADSETEIKSWQDIYAEWQSDETVIDTGDTHFDITPGGLQRTVSGEYSVTVTYAGTVGGSENVQQAVVMTVVLSKAATTFS